jgi:hypothetical protein
MLQTPNNFDTFANTLTCEEHTGLGLVSWTKSLWFREMSCSNRDWSGSCQCCNKRKPQYRWDAGMSARDRQIALSITGHMAPVSSSESQVPEALSPLKPADDECAEGEESNSPCTSSGVVSFDLSAIMHLIADSISARNIVVALGSICFSCKSSTTRADLELSIVELLVVQQEKTIHAKSERRYSRSIAQTHKLLTK